MSFLQLPSQQRSTTCYDPEQQHSIFRPKPPCRKSSTIGTRPHSHANADLGSLSSPDCRWLIYQEQQERALLMAEAAATSPLHCYSDHHCNRGWKREHPHAHEENLREEETYPQQSAGMRKSSCLVPQKPLPPIWKFKLTPLVITNDEVLRHTLDRAMDGVFQRIHGGIAARREANAPITQLEADECETRQRCLIEPWERGCSELGIFQKLLEDKMLMWRGNLRQLDLLRRLMSLVHEERLARLNLLGKFISCNPPQPCRHLLWDMEILTESVIPLEPAVDLRCLFTSIVIGEIGVLHNALLDERQRELNCLKMRERLLFFAFAKIAYIRAEGQARYRTLMAYHGFNKERAKQQAPPIDYFRYLDVSKTVQVEFNLRERILSHEFADVCVLMYMHETAKRRAVVVDEETERRCVVYEMEKWARCDIIQQTVTAARRSLRLHVFHQEARAIATAQHAREGLRERFFQSTAEMEALVVLEHKRRGSVMLLERQLRTATRLFMCAVSNECERLAVRRWMLDRARRLLERDEGTTRAAIKCSAETNIRCSAAAHAVVSAFSAKMAREAHQTSQRDAMATLEATEVLERGGIEGEWRMEREVLFEQRLCTPQEETRRAKRSEAKRLNVLDVRQIVISDLVSLLGDKAVLSVFAPLSSEVSN